MIDLLHDPSSRPSRKEPMKRAEKCGDTLEKMLCKVWQAKKKI